jgi:hypothetical protein
MHAEPYTAGGGGARGTTAPQRKLYFTIFRMSLLIILWVFGTFSAYRPYCPPGEKNPAYGPVCMYLEAMF